MSEKEIHDYFIRFTKIHPIALHKQEKYKNNLLITYQKLLLEKFNNKNTIYEHYIEYINQLDNLQFQKKDILNTINIIKLSIENEIKELSDIYLQLKINELEHSLFEL